MNVALAMTYHDPEGGLYGQLTRMLPVLNNLFSQIVVQASHVAYMPSLDYLAASGAVIEQDSAGQEEMGRRIGRARRRTLALALQQPCAFILYCDCDRTLHWAEHYPAELAEVVGKIGTVDLTVIGRTPRAFAAHPRVQRDTELIVNHVFALVSGHTWDIAAAARGLSRRAAEAIVAGCHDDNISTDASWPLFLLRQDSFTCAYLESEGMEFETQDRYGDEVAKAGGIAAWLAQMDADPRHWLHRLYLAYIEVEGMLPYFREK